MRVLLLLVATLASAAVHQDPSGFRVEVPDGWRVHALGEGRMVVSSPNPWKFVTVAPVLGRSADCATALRTTFANGWGSFPGARNVNVRPAGRGTAVAEFEFQNGQSRGAVLCAETGRRSGMFYGMAAPSAEFVPERGRLVSILRSFRYGSAPAARTAAAPAAAMPMEPWREASEGAFTAEKPTGWRAEGGVRRISNSDVRIGYRLSSPDGLAGIVMGDVRLGTCTVAGPGGQQFQQMGQNNGVEWCPYRTGEQAAEMYVLRLLAQDWGVQGMRVLSRRPRPDLSQESSQAAAAYGLKVRDSFGEVLFEGTRQGAPVTGRIVGFTQFMASVDPNLIAGTYTTQIIGFLGPRGRESALSSAVARHQGSVRWNVQWIMANRAAAQRDSQMAMRYLREQGERGQRMFEERMASADRRAAAVGDLLSGTVRLRDPEGRQYEAKAGSNYYYLNEQEARVVGSDAPLPPTDGVVDLRPLEVIR